MIWIVLWKRKVWVRVLRHYRISWQKLLLSSCRIYVCARECVRACVFEAVISFDDTTFVFQSYTQYLIYCFFMFLIFVIYRRLFSKASYKIPLLLWDSKVHYRVYKRLPPVLILSRRIQSAVSHPISLRSILILSSYPYLGLPNGLFPSGFLIKRWRHLSSHPCVLHAPHISYEFFSSLLWFLS
jgi:hypothetical protein